jgi:two-component system sensor histidine kinase KdpD
VILSSGSHVGRTLLRVAQELKVRLLILGKPAPRFALRFWEEDSPVGWLQQNSGSLEILLVPTAPLPDPEARPILGGFPESKRRMLRDYAGVTLVATAATAVGLFMEPFVGYWSVALVYLLGVTAAGVTLERSPTLALATMSALLWNWLFIPPRFTFYINRPQDLMMFAMFFVVALAVGHLTARLSTRERMETRLELRARALYDLTRQLAASKSVAEAVEAVVLQIKKVFELKAVVFLGGENGELAPVVLSGEREALRGKELRFLEEVYTNGRAQGMGAQSAALPGLLCVPLIVSGRIEGVLAVRLPNDGVLDPAQHELLDAFASQLAIVSEIQRLAQESRRIQLLADSEKLQKTLFDSVSHELKTPIAAIRVALEQPQFDVEEVRRANDRLHRSVECLLNATRVESGLLRLTREWCEAAEIVHGALALSRTEGCIQVSISESVPLVFVDVGLAVQSLATLLENAVMHGSSQPSPRVDVYESEGCVCFRVSDHGRGVRGKEDKIFEKFYRLPGTRAGGLGLGLSIARSLAEAQGGTLAALTVEHPGAVFLLQLPLGGKPQVPE